MHSLIPICTCLFLGSALARPNVDQKKIKILDDPSRFFEDHFNKTIECVRKHLIKGDPDKGIPSMDPLSFSKIVPVDIDKEYLTLNLELNKLVIDGLVAFQTRSLNLSHLLQLESIYHFDRITSTSLYTGDMNLLGLYTFYGDGNFDVEILDLNVTITTQYQMTPPLVGDYSVVINVGAINIKITGLLGDEEFSEAFSKIASTTVTTLVNILQKQITAVISPIIKEKINSYFEGIPFLTFLAIITDYTC